jgi:hypothetical protein
MVFLLSGVSVARLSKEVRLCLVRRAIRKSAWNFTLVITVPSSSENGESREHL